MPKLTKKAPKADKKMRMLQEMTKFKGGNLHSGAKDGPKVKDRKQAIAIGLSESGQSKEKAGGASKPKGKNASNRKKRNIGRH